MKNLKKFIVLTLALLLVMSYPARVSAVEVRTTKTVTTQKQFKTALKDDNIGTIVIKPKKKTTFDFKNIECDKDIKVYLDYATLKNIDQSDTGWITPYVSTQKQLENAFKMKRVINIYIVTKKKLNFEINESAEANNLFINTPNSNWVFNEKVWFVEVDDLENGTITDNADNGFRIEKNIKNLTVGKKAEGTEVQIAQDKVSKPVKMSVKGDLNKLTMYSSTPVEITFSKSSTTDYVFIDNWAEKTFSLTVNGKKQKVMNGKLNKDGEVLSYEKIVIS